LNADILKDAKDLIRLANDSTRGFTSLTFVYAVIQCYLEKRKDAGYVRLVDESYEKDPDNVIPGPRSEKDWN
jgi:hypothetical protein